MYKIVSDLYRSYWSDFVKCHPRGNIFQTPEMFDIFKASKNNYPLLTAVVDEEERPVGIMLSVVQKELNGIFGGMTARAIVRGGPLVIDNDEEITDLLISSFNDIIKKRAIYTQYRNFWDQRDERVLFEKHGFEYEEHLNILINLENSEEQLWNEVHSKRRNEIRRARKEGTTFKELSDPDELNIAYEILKKVYLRAKLPFHDKSMFDTALKILCPKGMIRYFGAVNNNKIIGTIVVLCYRDKIFDWYAGSYYEYYKKYPNDLLPWELFLWGKSNGYKIFDFGGAGKPGVPYGVRDYKKKFGGKFVNFGRYEKVNKKLLMAIGKFGMKLYKKLK